MYKYYIKNIKYIYMENTSNIKNSVTLVTCYYNIKSKRPHNDYLKYIDLLLKNLDKNINLIIYTASDLVYIFEKYLITHNNFKLAIKNFEDISLYNKYKEIWEHQYQKDKQKNTGRSYYCYILWNSKINFITETIDLNPFGSDKYIWIDVGCVRNNIYGNVIKNFGNGFNKISQNKIDIVLLKDFTSIQLNQKYFQDEIHFSGAIFAGTTDTFKKYSKLYYEKFDEYVKNDKFIGCDQQIISSVYLENIDLFNPINPKTFIQTSKLKLDPWFFLLFYYS